MVYFLHMGKLPTLTEVFASTLREWEGDDPDLPRSSQNTQRLRAAGRDPYAKRKPGAPSPDAGAKRPGPLLKKLLDAGTVYVIDNGTYMAKTPDGAEVQLGHETQDPKGIESYLAAHPTPDTW